MRCVAEIEKDEGRVKHCRYFERVKKSLTLKWPIVDHNSQEGGGQGVLGWREVI